jgi:hypothetical protein
MADVEFTRQENPNHYIQSNIATVDHSDLTFNISTFAGHTYYAILRSSDLGFPNMLFNPVIYYPDPSYVQVRTDYVNFDPLANPYLCFAALLMAGLDGVQNKIHPGEAASKDLYHLPPEEDAQIPTVCSSLDQALEYLDKDREFLTRGGVFSDTMIDAYIELKMQEVTRFRMTTHPVEFDMYYSL